MRIFLKFYTSLPQKSTHFFVSGSMHITILQLKNTFDMLKPAPRQKKKHIEDVFFFLCYTANLDAAAKKSIKSRGWEFLRRFHVLP